MKTHTFPITRRTNKQHGFSLMDFMIWVAIVAVVAAFAWPFINGLIIESRTQSTAKDIMSTVGAMQAAGSSAGTTTPYNNLGSSTAATAAFANASNGRATTLQVNGTGAGATVQHNLGASGSQITVASAANPTAGDSFDVTVPTANKAACPALANTLAKSSVSIKINGTFVKQGNGAYDGLTAQNLCTSGDTNTFVFTFH